MIRLWPGLKAGDAAPDFSLEDAKGKHRHLAEFKGKWLVLYFYPADFTPGCTAQSCAFRDAFKDFSALNAQILGISGDSREKHEAFGLEYGLPYALLSDPDARMRRAYTVPHVFGRMSGRTTFVIDPQGVIRYVFDSRKRHLDHVSQSLEFIKHAH